MTVLVTGAAGFIGFHVSQALLARGESVVGVDNFNDYYDVKLKDARVAQLRSQPRFVIERIDIADSKALADVTVRHAITRIVHLAAQAGVRYSLKNPQAYAESNLVGHLNVLEAARALPGLRSLVYASSSSVYGGNTKLPFSVDDKVDRPVSLYAATKAADELMSYAYSHLYNIPQTGLRFFTVYGPWGRPDMAYYDFTRAIFAGETIKVFNNGDMRRDFTWIDDVVAGVIAALDRPPAKGEGAPHRVYNIGNNNAENLLDFIATIEKACGKKARTELAPMQAGDVKETYADISAISRDLGFAPTTPIGVGIPKFVAWYRAYHKV
ncbi:MAG TPA: NAD-dependent epimerase/dehydratase family protein [Alphaproteobacteria bacterium]|nr:NAD-dependent epimerase/dehydratase family protein [Alphaproteobacteria bacterium]